MEMMKELDAWWARKLERELAGQAYQTALYLCHEIQEIRFCLDRPDPNIPMALDRISNIEKRFQL